MALLEKYLQVKPSTIPGAGMGLFTTIDIIKNQKIIEYKGRIRTWKEVEDKDGNYYIFYVNDNHVIDAQRRKKSLARYINDARGFRKIKGLTNNAEFICDGLRVFVYAKKRITAGSEIFVGYGKEYWDILKKNQQL